MTDNTNPLFKHFRHPAIHLRLPSKGKYWKEGDVDLPITNELPIFPMTVKDELTLRTPDALLNGSSIVELITSCVPNIKNVWEAPLTDIDSILIGVRIASYGSDMDVEIHCPSCKQDSDFCLDLRTVLDRINTAGYGNPIEVEGLKFKFKPQTYKESNKEDLIKFEENRMMAAISDSTLDDKEKKRLFGISFQAMTKIIVEHLISHIVSIETPTNELVTDREQILDFLMNCSRTTYNSIKDHITTLNESSKLKPLQVECRHCQHKFESGLIFDYSRFFG